jgi:hypothetical protein
MVSYSTGTRGCCIRKEKRKEKKNAIAYMHVCMCLHPPGCSGDDMRKREKREKNSR